MGRLRAWSENERKKAQQMQQEGFWPELCRRIDDGQVIPIIGNSVFFDQIFDIDGDQIVGISPGEDNPKGWSIDEQLANAWAGAVGFPLEEQHWLPRVALFDRVVNRTDERAAKTGYLNWLKGSLLYLAQMDADVDQDLVAELHEDIEQNSFADTAVQLGYPKPIMGRFNPLQTLAKLNLPIYITTSHFDFMERVLIAENKRPQTQICFWADEPLIYLDESHRPKHNLVPTVEKPLVFHIFGLETYPESMVLHEDDYLDFLTAIAGDANPKNSKIPRYLRKALTKSSLILLGYRLRDWEFRVMFRGLINSTPSSLRVFNLAIQLDPTKQAIVSAAQVRTYLEKYFTQTHFNVEWGTTQDFVQKLWETWNEWRK
jgi:hypothetical protein